MFFIRIGLFDVEILNIDGCVTDAGPPANLSICYIIDHNAQDLALVSMASILKLEPLVPFDFIILHPEWETPNIRDFEIITTRTRSHVRFLNFSKKHMKVGNSRETVYIVKMWLYELLPHVDRVLFLDADTMAVRPIAHLFKHELDGVTIMAVRAVDMYPVKWINSGVVMYNLKKIRELEMWKRMAFCTREHVEFVDDIWHTRCHNGTTIELPYRYNIMVHAVAILMTALKWEKREAVLVHFMKEVKEAFELDSPGDVDNMITVMPFVDRSLMKEWVILRDDVLRRVGRPK